MDLLRLNGDLRLFGTDGIRAMMAVRRVPS